MVIAGIANDTGRILAELCAYPHDAYEIRLDEARDCLAEVAPDAARHLAQFAEAVEALTPTEREELFTRTFDINPVGALEIGWHLFGEDYHRGALLARLRVEMRRHEIPETTELPDHLTHVLLLLDRMAPEEAEEFALACVLPALDKMLAAFRGKGNPYEHLLRCVMTELQGRFGAAYSCDCDSGAGGDERANADPFREELLPILDDWQTPPGSPNACAGLNGPGAKNAEDV